MQHGRGPDRPRRRQEDGSDRDEGYPERATSHDASVGATSEKSRRERRSGRPHLAFYGSTARGLETYFRLSRLSAPPSGVLDRFGDRDGAARGAESAVG